MRHLLHPVRTALSVAVGSLCLAMVAAPVAAQAVQLTPERVTGEWVFMDTVKARSLAIRPGKTMSVERGRRIFSA